MSGGARQRQRRGRREQRSTSTSTSTNSSGRATHGNHARMTLRKVSAMVKTEKTTQYVNHCVSSSVAGDSIALNE